MHFKLTVQMGQGMVAGVVGRADSWVPGPVCRVAVVTTTLDKKEQQSSIASTSLVDLSHTMRVAACRAVVATIIYPHLR